MTDESSPAYLNWDYLADREAILAARLPPRQRLLIFDELHKYAGWRGLIKGLYDKHWSFPRRSSDRAKMVLPTWRGPPTNTMRSARSEVTGSAR